MFKIVLFEPEIPPNTGNIIRLCANSGCELHLIEPLGFSMQERTLKRAGLDYHEFAAIQRWPDYSSFQNQQASGNLFALSTKGTRDYHSANFLPGDALLFGPETRGLPDWIRSPLAPDRLLRIPMLPGSRSLNLANAVTLVVYEAWRQNNFLGA